MRDYGKVFSSFWTSEDIRGLTEDGRALALYLMTCPHGNMLGCFRIPNAYAADDLQWTFERVSAGFGELYRNGFAYRCERSFWVVIHKHLKWNKLDNENVGKAAAKLFDSITPPDSVKALLVKALMEFGRNFSPEKLAEIGTVLEGYRNGIETLSKPVAVAVAVTGEICPSPCGAVVTSDAGDESPSYAIRSSNQGSEFAAAQVLEYLNEKAERDYRPVKANISLITARLKEGATIDECRAVVDAKVEEWGTDAKMRGYLRPKTLFSSTNFAQYAGELGGSGAGIPAWERT